MTTQTDRLTALLDTATGWIEHAPTDAQRLTAARHALALAEALEHETSRHEAETRAAVEHHEADAVAAWSRYKCTTYATPHNAHDPARVAALEDYREADAYERNARGNHAEAMTRRMQAAHIKRTLARILESLEASA